MGRAGTGVGLNMPLQMSSASPDETMLSQHCGQVQQVLPPPTGTSQLHALDWTLTLFVFSSSS